DMNMGGQVRSLPISAVSDVRYDYTYAGIKRKNNTRIITISGDVKEGFNANEVAGKVDKALKGFQPTAGVAVKFGGQTEDQAETMTFLRNAFGIAIGLMLLVLVGLFNSLGK